MVAFGQRSRPPPTEGLVIPSSGGWATRSPGVSFSTEQVVAVDVDWVAGPDCQLGISVTVGGVGHSYVMPLTSSITTLSSAETFVYPLGAAGLTRRLDQLHFSCAPGSSMQVDWVQVQDAVDVFPPPEELSFAWSDTRAPGGGLSTSIVRSAEDGWVYMGSDVGGFARHDPAELSWEVANGEGFTSLLQTGVGGVWDILPLDAPEEESGSLLFALVGDEFQGHVAGGLYTSEDRGDHWTQEATSWNNNGTGRVFDATEDDIGGYGRLTQCDGALGYGGGRLLQADARVPARDSTVYIANADEHARGVSIFDGVQSCPLPNAGEALPAEPIGAILRVDVEPSGTAALVVGYRGRPAVAPAVFVCELPDPSTTPLICGGAAAADCWPVEDSAGVDVRDLELDSYLELAGETGILVADGGNRPATSSSSCTAADTSIHELVLDDSSSLMSDLFDTLVGPADFPSEALAGTAPVTGISVDPGSGWLFVNIPLTPGKVYDYDRMMRIDMGDLHDGGSLGWEVVNSGRATTYTLEDPDEALRRVDSDYQGAWLEATVHGRSAPFPARSSPGHGIDTTWLESWPEGDGYWAAIPTSFQAWLVSGLAEPWGDTDLDGVNDAEEDTTWTFWPDIHADGRSFQTSVVLDVAIDSGGMAFAAAMDLGLEQTDLSELAGYGAEIDCLWDAWDAGGSSVAVAPLDGSLWLTLLDQSVKEEEPYPNNIGVARTTDQGATWSYSGGALSGLPYSETEGLEYARSCIDELDIRVATPFVPQDIASARAFLTVPGYEDADDDTVAPYGSTKQVEAIDQDTALVWFQPTKVGAAYETDGGLYLTADGGAKWHPVPFDGDWDADPATTDDCTAYTTFKNGEFDIVQPGARSAWFFDTEGAWDTALSTIQLVVGVPSASASADDDGANQACALAVVDIRPHPTVADTLDADWHWMALPSDNSTGCTLDRKQLTGLAVPRWADEVALWGGYTREFSGSSMSTRHGGVCLLDLDTETFSLLVDPAVDEYDIGAVAPSPDIADLYVVLPARTHNGWQECQELGTGGTPGTTCPDAPLPRLYWRTGTGWTVRTLSDAPPTPRINAASWSPVGAGPNGLSATWLGVGTGGSGMWVGKATW